MKFSQSKRLALGVSLFLVLGLNSYPTHGAENVFDENQSWALPDDSGLIGSQNGLFTERSSDDRDYSALIDTSKLANNQLDPTCASLDDSKCLQSDNFIFYAQIPFCVTVSENNCISEINAIGPDGKVFPAKFARYFPERAQNQFQGNIALNLPSGGAGSLVNIPGAEGPAGNLYYASFILQGVLSRNSTSIVRTVHASLVPVQLQNDARFDNWKYCQNENKTCDTGWNKLDLGSGKYFYNESGTKGTNCADTSWAEKICAQKEAFPAGFKYSMKVRLSLAPTGWMHGRMTDPDITLMKVGGVTELTVSAEPVSVPAVYKHYQWVDMPSELRSLYDPTTGKYRNSNGEGFIRSALTTDPTQRAWTTAPSPYSPIAIAELNAWLPYVNNTSTVVPKYWSFRSLTQAELESANKCFSDPAQLNGIVTTNSTAYSPGPPAYDKIAGDLNYKVAAPHFLPNGKDSFKGTYDLLLISNAARCIYGFSNAPIKASISVISSDGSPQVATTVVSEKNGWLHLSAKNFEFSSPIVSVKLAQDEPAPTPTPNASAKPIVKVVTINCVKGKVTKKVSSANPKCPSGFKKK